MDSVAAARGCVVCPLEPGWEPAGGRRAGPDGTAAGSWDGPRVAGVAGADGDGDVPGIQPGRADDGGGDVGPRGFPVGGGSGQRPARNRMNRTAYSAGIAD